MSHKVVSIKLGQWYLKKNREKHKNIEGQTFCIWICQQQLRIVLAHFVVFEMKSVNSHIK